MGPADWDEYAYLKKALHYGIDLVQWMVDWYAQAERDLEAR